MSIIQAIVIDPNLLKGLKKHEWRAAAATAKQHSPHIYLSDTTPYLDPEERQAMEKIMTMHLREEHPAIQGRFIAAQHILILSNNRDYFTYGPHGQWVMEGHLSRFVTSNYVKRGCQHLSDFSRYLNLVSTQGQLTQMYRSFAMKHLSLQALHDAFNNEKNDAFGDLINTVWSASCAINGCFSPLIDNRNRADLQTLLTTLSAQEQIILEAINTYYPNNRPSHDGFWYDTMSLSLRKAMGYVSFITLVIPIVSAILGKWAHYNQMFFEKSPYSQLKEASASFKRVGDHTEEAVNTFAM